MMGSSNQNNNGAQMNQRHQSLILRQDADLYPRHWKTSILDAFGERPGFCCYALFCGCCTSYSLRKQALYGDLSRYECCANQLVGAGMLGEQKCPAFCLCLEVSCCFGLSVSSTRFMLQDEMRIQSSNCDTCVIAFMISLQYLACICNIIACVTGDETCQQFALCLDLFADIVWCSVCSCIQTQHKIEMDERDKITLVLAEEAQQNNSLQLIQCGNFQMPVRPKNFDGPDPAAKHLLVAPTQAESPSRRLKKGDDPFTVPPEFMPVPPPGYLPPPATLLHNMRGGKSFANPGGKSFAAAHAGA